MTHAAPSLHWVWVYSQCKEGAAWVNLKVRQIQNSQEKCICKISKIQSKTYLEKRRKNNEAAKRSREKRRKQELHLEQRVMELKEENDNFIR